jgi:L-alanine-DL-glutamate epimerase-like enolase superfamily enzyme
VSVTTPFATIKEAVAEIREGRMVVPNRPGLGFTISEQARAWTVATHEEGKRA